MTWANAAVAARSEALRVLHITPNFTPCQESWASEQDTAEGIVAEMLKLHRDRDNPYTLWLSARRVAGNRS